MQRLREARGWSQNELARRLVQAGLKTYTATVVGRTEKGGRTMRLDEALEVAHALGVDITALVQKDSTQATNELVRTVCRDLEVQFTETAENIVPYLESYEHLYQLGKDYRGQHEGRVKEALTNLTLWMLLCESVQLLALNNPDIEQAIEERGIGPVTTEVTGLRPDLHLPPEKTN